MKIKVSMKCGFSYEFDYNKEFSEFSKYFLKLKNGDWLSAGNRIVRVADIDSIAKV